MGLPSALLLFSLLLLLSLSSTTEGSNTNNKDNNNKDKDNNNEIHLNKTSALLLCSLSPCNFIDERIWVEPVPASFSGYFVFVDSSSLINLFIEQHIDDVAFLLLSNTNLQLNEDSRLGVDNIQINQSSLSLQGESYFVVNYNLLTDENSTIDIIESAKASIQTANFECQVNVSSNATFSCFNCSFSGQATSTFNSGATVTNIYAYGTQVRFIGGVKTSFVGAYSGSFIEIQYDHYSDNLYVDYNSNIYIHNANSSTFFFADDALYGNGTITVSAAVVGFISGSPDVANFDGTIVISQADTVLFNTMRIASISFSEDANNVTVEAATVEFSQSSLHIPGSMVVSDNQVALLDGELVLDGCLSMSYSVVHLFSSLTCLSGNLAIESGEIHLEGNITAELMTLSGESILNVHGASPSFIFSDVSLFDFSFVSVYDSAILNVNGSFVLSNTSGVVLENITHTNAPVSLHGNAIITGILNYTLVDNRTTYKIIISDQNITGQFINVTQFNSNMTVVYSPHEITLNPFVVPIQKHKLPLNEIILGGVGIVLLLSLVLGVIVSTSRKNKRQDYQAIN